MNSHFSKLGCVLFWWLTSTLIGACYGQDANPRVWGDLGDGTYRNPVLNADFADSDIERDGQRWVMITSTNHLAPGMTLLESEDLVNWRYLGHVWDRLSWDARYEPEQMAGYRWGVWAGDLVKRENEWLCYQIDYQNGLFMSKAPHIEGPWSNPICLLRKTEWTDPAVYFDETTHRAWLIANFGKLKDGVNHDIRIFEMNWAGDQLLDEGKSIYIGPKAEAAKVHKIFGRWYVLLIKWEGTGAQRDRKQICLRSEGESILGPYEERTIFEREQVTDRSACQGSLVQTDDGKWWYMHQLVQNGKPVFHGRPQCLQPVHWIDDWPIIGRDVDADGVGEPIWQHMKPQSLQVSGADSDSHSNSSFKLQTSDEFDSQILGPQWNWNHNPRDDFWSLSERPGWLRLKASVLSEPQVQPSPARRSAFWRAPNTLSQRQLGTRKTSTVAKLDISGMQPGAKAGICHHSGKFALFGVQSGPSSGHRLFYETALEKHTIPLAEATREVYLRSQTQGAGARFSWSIDGKQWTSTPWKYTLNFGNWRGNRPGLFHFLEDDSPTPRAQNRQHGYVDIDYFRYLAPHHRTSVSTRN